MSSLRVRVSRAALVGWAAGSAAPVLRGGQCELVQLPSYGLAGADGFVRAVCTWDPDGEGPLPENLIAIGGIRQAGTALCSQIAMFDGENWSSFGTDLETPGDTILYDVTAFDGELIVGGFLNGVLGVSARGVVRWDGTIWQTMGPELRSVSQFIQSDGHLFAVGSFAGTGGGSTVVRWNGSQWSAIVPPIVTTGALAVDDAGNLIVVGPMSFDDSQRQKRVARWDGESWALLGGPLSPELRCVVAYGDDIFVGGLIPVGGRPALPYLARWDGEDWLPTPNSIGGAILSFYNRGDDLLVGGGFQTLGGVTVNRIARWDGSVFGAFGSGPQLGTHKNCHEMTNFRNEPIAAGEFGQAGGVAVANIARWDGVEWSQIGGEFGRAGTSTLTQATSVYAVGEYQGDVILAGNRNLAVGSQNIARRNAEAWIALGSGLPFKVLALTETPHGLLAGGVNSSWVPGSLEPPVALWSGETWESIGHGSLPDEVIVYAVAEYQDEFIVAGYLRTSTDLGEGNIRRWTGSEWLALGPPTSSVVTDVLVQHGELFAAGRFVGPAGEDIRGIARWDGDHWSPIGTSNNLQ